VSIRQAINNNRGVSTGAAAAVVLVAIGFVVFRVSGLDNPTVPPQDASWFTTDDGKSYFADDLKKVAPFQTADGRTAVKAIVYQCGEGGAPFVNHLERYNPEALKLMQGGGGRPAATQPAGESGAPSYSEYMRTQGGGRDPAMTARYMGVEVKKPGQGEWINRSDVKSLAITTPKCPDGSSARLVAP
jgi:hypothetical protein